jgi:hypothetical protein
LVKPCLWTVLAYWFLAANAAFAAQGSGQLANVTIAYTSVSPQYAPVWIAKEAGVFRRNGVNAQLVYMRGGVLATQALVSDDVNFINAGGGGVVDAVLGGADIFMIASPINQEPQVLVAKKEIKDIRQLRGKRPSGEQPRRSGDVVFEDDPRRLRFGSGARCDLSSNRSIGEPLRRAAVGTSGGGDPGAAVYVCRAQGGLHLFRRLTGHEAS